MAGVFLFLPLLVKLRFDQIVAKAGYPGSEMIPAFSALLALLTLKLLDKERRSHINDFNFDEALGLFAGLNILPKKSYATDYSYLTTRENQPALLEEWVHALGPVMFPEANTFSLDFHPIPYRGDPTGLDQHYLPRRGVAGPSVQTCFALEQESRCLCYANANLTRADQNGELMRFVEFWHTIMGSDPQWLYLRFQAHRLPGTVARQPTRHPLHHHSSSRYGDPAPAAEAATIALDGCRTGHASALSSADPVRG